MMQRIKVWDLPVRLGHWLLVAGFVIAWLSGDSEEWRLVHVYAGSVVLAVALFRLLWGFIGSRHARFSAFIHPPMAAFVYLKNLAALKPHPFTGHNPAGGWAILWLLALAMATSSSGWLVYQEMFGEWLVTAHDILATSLLVLVILHLAGVAAGSIAHHENLIHAMLTGHKPGNATEAIRHSHYSSAILLIIWVVAASWWLAQ